MNKYITRYSNNNTNNSINIMTNPRTVIDPVNKN